MKGYSRNAGFGSEGSIFENAIDEESGSASGFSLEAMVRSSAQRMIQGVLEAEVTEFLQRLRGQKSADAEGFRGYRNGFHKERRISTDRRFRSPRSALHLMFKLLLRAEKGWQTLSHAEKLKEVKLPDEQKLNVI